MTFKKGDRVRLKDHIDLAPDRIFVLYADQVGDQIWAGNEKDVDHPYPSTWLADNFDLVPSTPAYGQIWSSATYAKPVVVVNVCGEWVIYEPVPDGNFEQDLKNARRIDDFQSRYTFQRSTAT